MKCIICKCERFNKIEKQVRDSTNHSIVICKKCGHTQLYPTPSLAEEKEFYDKNLQSKNISLSNNIKKIRVNSDADTKRRADFISGYCDKKSQILDIGSGDGFFLKEMKNRGYQITGLEISKERRKTSQKVTEAKILNINLMDKLTIKKDLRRFDCVTLFHVLEHIIDPAFFLKNIKNYLIRRNGTIVIEVPNSEDLLLSANKEYRNFYWQRAHLSYFNRKTLTQVVKEAGFSIKNVCYIQRYGLENFMNWLITGKPQINKPAFQIDGTYKWLEDYYKKCLNKIGRSDTLIIVAKS